MKTFDCLDSSMHNLDSEEQAEGLWQPEIFQPFSQRA
jgi:hypothetical protein